MRFFLKIILTILLGVTSGAISQDRMGGMNTFSRTELSEMGIVRISDILSLGNEWQGSTLSGYLHQTSINGLDPFNIDPIQIYLDGQEITPNLLNMVNLESLPIDISMIDSIVVINTGARMEDGERPLGGTIHIYSRSDEVNFAAKLGNETGEPGPYRYTSRKTPNIDTIGPLTTLGLAREMLKVRFGFYASGQIFMFTDQTVHRRNQDLLEGKPNEKRWLINSVRPEMMAGSFLIKSEYKADRFTGKLLHHQSYDDKLMTFFEPLSRELPFDILRKRSVASGKKMSKQGTWDMKWSFNDDALSIIERYNRINFESDWKLRSNRVHIGIGHVWKTAGYSQIGVNRHQYHLSSLDSTTFTPRLTTEYAIYVNHLMRFRRAYQILVDFDLTRVDQHGYFRSHFEGGYCGVSLPLKIKLALGYSELPTWKQNQLDDLNGFLLQMVGQNLDPGSYTITPASKSIKRNIDLLVSQEISLKSKWQMGIHLRSDHNMGLNRLDSVQFVKPGRGFFTHFVYNEPVDGVKTSIDLTWQYASSSTLRHTFYISRNGVLSGDPLFSQTHEHIPKLVSRYGLCWRAHLRFTTELLVHYDSGSKWEEYRSLEGIEWPYELELQTHSPDIPAALTFDLTFKKKFWKENIDAAIVIKNIFDQMKILHPIGGDLGRTVYLVLNIHPF